eukprot:TRINITY_DN1223_c0_g1_i1.p1 TRINITY_DN1223_c0_g1~~TRINITY_DN1223_c0_g1_i1.p1  ORF type:complete len:493 (+),score=116.30 TRINITY_DN1223_c0_g1_i1:101-1579(+)
MQQIIKIQSIQSLMISQKNLKMNFKKKNLQIQNKLRQNNYLCDTNDIDYDCLQSKKICTESEKLQLNNEYRGPDEFLKQLDLDLFNIQEKQKIRDNAQQDQNQDDSRSSPKSTNNLSKNTFMRFQSAFIVSPVQNELIIEIEQGNQNNTEQQNLSQQPELQQQQCQYPQRQAQQQMLSTESQQQTQQQQQPQQQQPQQQQLQQDPQISRQKQQQPISQQQQPCTGTLSQNQIPQSTSITQERNLGTEQKDSANNPQIKVVNQSVEQSQRKNSLQKTDTEIKLEDIEGNAKLPHDSVQEINKYSKLPQLQISIHQQVNFDFEKSKSNPGSNKNSSHTENSQNPNPEKNKMPRNRSQPQQNINRDSNQQNSQGFICIKPTKFPVLLQQQQQPQQQQQQNSEQQYPQQQQQQQQQPQKQSQQQSAQQKQQLGLKDKIIEHDIFNKNSNITEDNHQSLINLKQNHNHIHSSNLKIDDTDENEQMSSEEYKIFKDSD